MSRFVALDANVLALHDDLGVLALGVNFQALSLTGGQPAISACDRV